MRHRLLVAILFLSVCGGLWAHPVRDTLGVGVPVNFVENLGQWDARVRYQAQLHDVALFLEDDGITVALRSPVPHPAPYSAKPPAHHAYKMVFEGGGAMPGGEGRQPGYSNYYLGNDASRWRSRVASYAAVRYVGVYPGIDLEIYTASGALKYNFIVHPGADAGRIRLRYEGTDGVSVAAGGDLRVRTTVRDVAELKPYCFQSGDGGKEREVRSRWRVGRDGGAYVATVEVGAYDTGRDLVVDPTLIFSTYTGSTADNWGTTATYDSQKNTYTAGLVFDIGYPVSLGAYDPDYNGAVDIGIFKFDTSGTRRLFATYLGGSAADMPHSMYANGMDELLIFGTTGSEDFPTTAGAYQRAHAGGTLVDYESSIIRFPNGSDIFVSRFSADGTALEASTLVGGSGNDGLNYKQHYNNSYIVIMAGNDSLYYNYGDGARGEIVTDRLGNVYVGSTTTSPDFPVTAGAVQTTPGGGQDGVIFKLDYGLRSLLWSSYLGGTADDAVYSIDVDTSGSVLLCGGTASSDFPVTAGTVQTAYGGGTADGFVSRVADDGSRLLASSFLGSAAYDQLYFVRAGNDSEVFLFGQTAAPGGEMIHNAGYSVYGSGMLLARLAPGLESRRWSTVFGTPGRINLSPTAFAADICNRVYAAGWGRDFVGYNGVQWNTAGTAGMETTPDAYSGTTDGQDFYIISLDADANRLEYATFFGEMHQSGSYYGGGDHVDGGTSRFDRLATLYQSVCGSCGGTQGFPTTAGAWSSANLSTNCNNALFRFNITNNFPVAEFVAPQSGCAPYSVSFRNTGRGTAFHWDFGDGATSDEHSPTHTYTRPGTYTVTLVASLPGGCSEADTASHTLQVLSPANATHTLLLACGTTGLQIGPAPVPGATYRWTEGNVSDPGIANPWVTDAGRYILETTTPGCTQTDTFLLRRYTLVARLSTSPVSCHDSADGTATLRLGADVEADSIAYTITPAAPADLGGGYLVFRRLAPQTSYSITVSGYGCTFGQEVRLDNPAPVAYTKEVSAALCTDSCTGWIRITHLPEIDTLMEQLCEGTYHTRLTVQGCPLDDTSHIVRNRTLDSLRVWADAERILLGESVRLHAETGAPDGGGVGYEWYPLADLDRPDTREPLATPADTAACYSVTATAGGCSAKDSLCIRCTEIVCGPPYFVIPNAFTPNADGVNDAVCFPVEGITEFSIDIFNRWGERVYSSTDPSACWDGTFRGTPCLPGVYTYTCHIRCLAGEENDFKGDITLLR